MKFNLLLSISLLLISSLAFSQPLERSAYLGIRYAPAQEQTDSNLPRGVDIMMVMPSSSASESDLRKGDRIVQCNGTSINEIMDLTSLLDGQKVGETLSLKIIRDGRPVDKNLTLMERPKEKSDAYDVTYGEVDCGESIIRSYLTRPRTAATDLPAVMIIQGIGCRSIENPFNWPSSISLLVDSLTRAGMVTMRMERTGLGDSQGQACDEVDFKTDLSNFKKGLEELQTLDYVDPEKVFIIGLSMGGIMAPILASEMDIKGLIVYGTGGKDWYSYEIDNTLRQALLEDTPTSELKALMDREHQRLHYFFTEKMTPDEIREVDEEMGEACDSYPQHYSYFQQVADLDIYGIWGNNTTPMLSIHGSSDFLSAAAEHALIADLVERNHPGTAKYIEWPGADHWMHKTESERASMERKSEGLDTELIGFLRSWIEKQL